MQRCAAVITNIRLDGIFDPALRTIDNFIFVSGIRVHNKNLDLIDLKSSGCGGKINAAHLKL
jgi:hypothetical protein